MTRGAFGGGYREADWWATFARFGLSHRDYSDRQRFPTAAVPADTTATRDEVAAPRADDIAI